MIGEIRNVRNTFKIERDKTPPVKKSEKLVKTGIDTSSTSESVRFSETKKGEAETHYMTYDKNGQIFGGDDPGLK